MITGVNQVPHHAERLLLARVGERLELRAERPAREKRRERQACGARRMAERRETGASALDRADEVVAGEGGADPKLVEQRRAKFLAIG